MSSNDKEATPRRTQPLIQRCALWDFGDTHFGMRFIRSQPLIQRCALSDLFAITLCKWHLSLNRLFSGVPFRTAVMYSVDDKIMSQPLIQRCALSDMVELAQKWECSVSTAYSAVCPFGLISMPKFDMNCASQPLIQRCALSDTALLIYLSMWYLQVMFDPGAIFFISKIKNIRKTVR